VAVLHPKPRMSPYSLHHYVIESGDVQVKDYAVLAHSGHRDQS
jgi:hypothetical protein